jgi:hypothetical protein
MDLNGAVDAQTAYGGDLMLRDAGVTLTDEGREINIWTWPDVPGGRQP